MVKIKVTDWTICSRCCLHFTSQDRNRLIIDHMRHKKYCIKRIAKGKCGRCGYRRYDEDFYELYQKFLCSKCILKCDLYFN